MKVYHLTDKDFKALLIAIDRDPAHGRDGGSSRVLTDEETKAFREAHRFYNYHIRGWIDDVCK